MFAPAVRHARSGRAQTLLALVATLGVMPSAGGDEFVLKSGARIHGEWLNSTETPIRRYVVQCQPGARVTIDARQVSEHIRESSEVAEYHRIAPRFPDTVASQLQLAEWCRVHDLKQQQREHLWRVIELDPDHADARRALGFNEIAGRWVTTKEFFQERGYVYYRGKWRLPQEVELLEEQRQIDRQEREWFAQLKTWRGQLGTEREQDAVQKLIAIDDPKALKALADYLHRERSRDVRCLLVRAIANIRAPGAIELLTTTALNDPDVEVFHECVDKLVARQTVGLSKALADVLRDPNNRRVNRAAHVLGRLGDRKVVPALAGALVTTHEVPIPSSGRTSATIVQPVTAGNGPSSPAASMDSGTAFTAGRTPKSAPVQIANQEVLAALVKLSGGQSFGFDERAWMNWWASASRTGFN
jgi:hypothetical protein